MAETSPVELRMLHRSRLTLCAGTVELVAMVDTMVAKIKAAAAAGPENADARTAACKAFEAVFRKTGALSSGFSAAHDRNKWSQPKVDLSTAVSLLRTSMEAIGGAWRESPEVVLGSAALGDPIRVQLALDTIEEIVTEINDKVPVLHRSALEGLAAVPQSEKRS